MADKKKYSVNCCIIFNTVCNVFSIVNVFLQKQRLESNAETQADPAELAKLMEEKMTLQDRLRKSNEENLKQLDKFNVCMKKGQHNH